MTTLVIEAPTCECDTIMIVDWELKECWCPNCGITEDYNDWSDDYVQDVE